MACEIVYEEAATLEEKDTFEKALANARVAATLSKNTVENTWFGVNGGTLVTEQQWFIAHYDTAGQEIGPHRRLDAIMKKLEGYTKVKAETEWTVTLVDKKICTVGLYRPDTKLDLEDGNTRPVYDRDANGVIKQYVLDDAGIPTRRYAFCVRQESGGAPMLKGLPKSKDRPWKFTSSNGEWNTAMSDAIKAISKGRNTWHTLSVKAKVCLAYVNYANNGKLGVCLSATPKRVRDNKGKAFLDDKVYTIWKVDLAKIPTTSVLINIYAREPKDEQWTANNNGDTKGGVWISQGTIKNRELFCSAVPPTAATKKATPNDGLLDPENWSWKEEEFFQPL